MHTVPMCSSLCFPIVNILHHHGAFVKTRKPKFASWTEVYRFFHISPLLHWFNAWTYFTAICHVSFCLLWLVTMPQSFPIFHGYDSFKRPCSDILKNIFHLDISVLLLMIRLGLWAVQNNNREVHSHCRIRIMFCEHGLQLAMITCPLNAVCP